jgi:flagellar hook-length control protein FliK
MELALLLDAGAPAPEPGSGKAPGTDPNDVTAQAFASLLATLVAATAPPADQAAPTLPEDATAQAAVAPVAVDVPTAPVVPTLAFDALPAVSGTPEGAAAVPTVDVEPAPTLHPEAPAAAVAEQVDLEVEVDAGTDVDAPGPARHEATSEVRPTAVQLPEAVAPVAVAAAPSIAPSTTEAPAEDAPDTVDVAAPVNHPSAHPSAAPAREVIKPEIVTGPRPHVPSSPVEQVVKAVAPLRKLADGTHNVVLELHPAELGTVRVELSLDRGMVHLGLHADVEGTGHLLRAALPELRHQLGAAGLTAGRVAVDADQSAPRQPRPDWQADPNAQRRQGSHEPEPELVPTGYSTSEYGRVDVRL